MNQVASMRFAAMKVTKRKLLCSRTRGTVRRLLFSALLLFPGMTSFANDQLIIEAKVNGNPVRFMFDTGSETSCLFRRAAQRLGLSFSEPRQEQSQIKDGKVNVGLTEEFRLSFGYDEEKVRFRLMDIPSFLKMGVDGLIAWADMTNSLVQISADDRQVSVLDALPADIAQWAKWNLRADSRCLAIEVPVADGERKYVYINTGMDDGVELGERQWKRWRSENPNAPATLRAYYTPSDGTLVSEQCWARSFSLGNISVPDTPIAPSAPAMALFMKDHEAVLGLFALTRFDVILDKKNGCAYMKPKSKSKAEFTYNKTGAVFAPTKTNSNDLVAHVAEKTPAYEAGIRNGDILLKIDDLDVTKWQTDPNVLPLSRFFARSAGTQLQLVLARDGQPYTAKVILRDLFGPSCAPPCDSAPSRLLDYRAAAEQGDPEAQHNLGNCFYEGKGVATNHTEAVAWWRKAAEQNYPVAQNNLGNSYCQGEGVVKDEVEAVRWYRKAADQDYAVAQYNLGRCYANGQGVKRDFVEAAKWYRKAAEQNYVMAQVNLGFCYENGKGVARDYEEAVRWYRKAAERNDAVAQNHMGNCYAKGHGLAIDKVEAVKWYRKAAEQRNAVAQYNLGHCYADGQGVSKDEAEAMCWFRKAVEQNLAEAQFNLGNWYCQGKVVEKDAVEAVKWWRKAADQNHAVAQANLGVCYRDGQGVAKDEAEAVKWFLKAARQNFVQAQNNLGVCYMVGQGVEKDKVEAYKWWLLADAQGDVSAKQNRARLERQLTLEQQEDGRRRANDFKPPEVLFRDVQSDEASEPSAQNTDPVIWAEKALAKAEKNLGDDHPEVAACLCRLADAYAAQGQHALAASMFRRALSIKEKALGQDHAEVAEVLEKLAVVYRKNSFLKKEAIELEKRAAAIRAIKR